MTSHQHHYDHTAENIPLGKVSTFDDEQKIYYQQQEEIHQSHKHNRDSHNSIYQVKQSKFSLFVQPLLSVVLSAFFATALLLLFLYADGKPLDYTLVGMKIPSLVSLLLSINAIFLASGISKAVAEYKWVKLQNGTPLTMIDIYDACTRGLGGFFITLRALQFDLVLVAALIFHLGLLVVSPVSQAILVPFQGTMERYGGASFHFNPSNSYLGRSKLGLSGQAPKMNGFLNNGYLTASSFAQASLLTPSTPLFDCPNGASYCEYKNVSFITTKMSCQNITSDDTALVWHNNTNNVVVLKEYLTSANISGTTVDSFPKFFYATEMLGRTSFELDNWTEPMIPGLNTPLTLADIKNYDPQYRPYVGDQSFVMAYNTLQPKNGDKTFMNYTQLSFRKCSLQSSLNTTDWITQNGTLVKTGVETSVPINFDYDNVLGNNVALYHIDTNVTTGNMVVAYLMQQSILLELIRPKYYKMYEYLNAYYSRMIKLGQTGNMSSIDMSYGSLSSLNLLEAFLSRALTAFDYAVFQTPFLSGNAQSTMDVGREGTIHYNLVPVYRVEKAAAYTLCLCLLLPIAWWIIIWFYSLKKNNGIARANSQIVLLATNMTPDAERNLRGISGLDSSNAFKRAKDIRIRLGVVQQHPVVGLDHENHLRPFA